MGRVLKRSQSCKRRRDSTRRAAKPIISWGWRWRDQESKRKVPLRCRKAGSFRLRMSAIRMRIWISPRAGPHLPKANWDKQAASAAYRRALELNPSDAQAKHALEYYELPDNPVSVAKPTGADTEDDQAKVAEFEGYIRQNRFQEVEPLLADYVSQRPTSAWGWYALGYSQFAQKKVGDSIRSLAKSLQLDIRNAEAHKMLGRDLMMVGRCA